MNEPTGPLPGPSAQERKWGTICHISALAGLLGNGVGFVLGPLIVWYMKKDEFPFVDAQGKEALNFQITMFIALLVSAALTLVVIGIFLVFAVVVVMTVFPILAAVKTNAGESYRYPMAYRFIK